MIFFPVLITVLYCLLIGGLVLGWRKIPVETIAATSQLTGFSIIVPYRNEAENLPPLLSSLQKLNYPRNLFEVILVNDDSTDASELICSRFKEENPEMNLKLINSTRISKAPKKDAIFCGIKNAHFPYIITTDADCIVGKGWLQIFNNKILVTGAKLVAGPVSYFPVMERRYFQVFQEMDFLSLQGAGAGGFGLNRPFMCNAANLCYEKAAFAEVKGFSGNENISSGDDVFLLQKFSDKKIPVAFLKSADATVFTKPQPDPDSLISQRIRWAAKTPAYTSFFAITLGISVLLMNIWILVGGILYLLQLIDDQLFLVSFFLKFIVDLGLLYHSADFFRRKRTLRHFFWGSILYPLFSVYVAILSLFRGFEWKGRKFKN